MKVSESWKEVDFSPPVPMSILPVPNVPGSKRKVSMTLTLDAVILALLNTSYHGSEAAVRDDTEVLLMVMPSGYVAPTRSVRDAGLLP
jgi:hypothetical protein